MNQSFTILGLETATQSCSVALFRDNQFSSRHRLEAKKSSEFVLPMLYELLEAQKCQLNEIAGIAVGVGPGSFTGVRVAVGLAKAMGFALNIPVWPISTLRALAQEVYTTYPEYQSLPILTTWDARMHAIYWGVYEHANGLVRNQLPQDQLSSPCDLSIPFSPGTEIVVAGSGMEHYAAELEPCLLPFTIRCVNEVYPNAEAIIGLALQDKAQGIQPASLFELSPDYVRNDVAKIPKSMNMPVPT